MRLAIGDVYKVLAEGFDEGTLAYTFEICGEAFKGGKRFVWGVKHGMKPAAEGACVIFDENGIGESLNGDIRWIAWEISRAKPRYKRPPVCK